MGALNRSAASETLAERADIDDFNKLLISLTSCGDGAEWRMVELDGEGPFRARVQWTKAGKGPTEVRLTVARSTRLFINASSIVIHAANLSSSTNKIGVSVVDAPGPLPAEHQWEEIGAGVENVGALHAVPPFATRVSVDFQNRSSSEAAVVALIDGDGVTIAETTAQGIDEAGWPLGGAASVKVVAGIADEPYRVLFILGI